MGYRAILVRVLTFLGGLYFFLEFVLPESIGDFRFGAYHDQITVGLQTIGGMALGLGVINLLYHHGSRIIYGRTGTFNSVALLAGMFLMTVVVGWDWISTRHTVNESEHYAMLGEFSSRIAKDASEENPHVLPAPERTALLFTSLQTAADTHRKSFTQERKKYDGVFEEEFGPLQEAYTTQLQSCQGMQEALPTGKLPWGAQSQTYQEQYESLAVCLRGLSSQYRAFAEALQGKSVSKHFHDLLFHGLFVALGSAMFSLLGFYIAGAAYRAFRVQSFESACMMIAAFVVMLGQIPFGVWIWDGFPELRNWLLSVPSTAAFRAIKIGAALAGLIMAFRMWLSIESGSFSKGKKE